LRATCQPIRPSYSASKGLLLIGVYAAGGGGSRQWIDMTPYVLKDNTVYFSGPNEVIVKEGITQIWSTGIAFTREFLSLQENGSISKLPLIQNPNKSHELLLTSAAQHAIHLPYRAADLP
jgi:hypothetical protein